MTVDHEQTLDPEETHHCYRHPDRETALSCNSCERPMCVDCAVTAAVGMKCRECARLPRAALATVPRSRLLLAAAAGSAAAVVGAGLYLLVLGRISFFLLVLAYAVGVGVGELVRRAAGGYRDKAVERIAIVAAGLVFLLPVALRVAAHGPGVLDGNVFVVLAGIVAGYAAHTRI